MRTIGYKHRGPLRDHTSFCDICGVAWLRSELTGPDDDGYFRCPDDAEGRATKTLDYIRALNSSQPSEVNGVRDRPGQTPTNVQLVGWAWALGGTAERLAGTLRSRKVGTGLYTFEGATLTSAVAFPFDQSHPAGFIPRFYYASVLDASAVLVRGHNRLTGDDDTHAITSGTGSFVVFLYSNTGGEGVLTEVGWAWVSGAGALLDGDGNVSVTRTATGRYTATLASGTYAVAQVQQFSSAAVSGVEPAFVWAGKVSPSVAGIRSLNTLGVEVDADFMVRLWR